MQVSVNLHHLQQQEYSLDKELREVRALRSALEQWELAAGYSPKIRQLLRAAEQEEEYITDRRRVVLQRPRLPSAPAAGFPQRNARRRR